MSQAKLSQCWGRVLLMSNTSGATLWSQEISGLTIAHSCMGAAWMHIKVPLPHAWVPDKSAESSKGTTMRNISRRHASHRGGQAMGWARHDDAQ